MSNQTRRKDKGLPGNGGRYAATEHVADDSVGLTKGQDLDQLERELDESARSFQKSVVGITYGDAFGLALRERDTRLNAPKHRTRKSRPTPAPEKDLGTASSFQRHVPGLSDEDAEFLEASYQEHQASSEKSVDEIPQQFDDSDGFATHDYSALKVDGIVSMTKFKNALKKARPDLEVNLKNIRINGQLRGCSGFITDPRTDRTLYVNTESSAYRGTAYFRSAKDNISYGGAGTGDNHMVAPKDVVSESLRFMETASHQQFYAKPYGSMPKPTEKARSHEIFLEDRGIRYSKPTNSWRDRF